MNKLKLVVSAFFFLFSSFIASAQVSSDSMQSLKQQKQSLELSKKINDNKMKLAKLENTLKSKSDEMESTTAAAQRSADDNSNAANKLSSDPLDKKLARQAESAGNHAKKNAKHARIAGDKLESLTKEIQSLKEKIAADEAKLANNPLIVPTQQ